MLPFDGKATVHKFLKDSKTWCRTWYTALYQHLENLETLQPVGSANKLRMYPNTSISSLGKILWNSTNIFSTSTAHKEEGKEKGGGGGGNGFGLKPNNGTIIQLKIQALKMNQFPFFCTHHEFSHQRLYFACGYISQCEHLISKYLYQ